MYPYVSEFSGECVNDYAEMNINEVNLVGAGIGGGFEVTSELKVMNFKKAMKSDEKEKWLQAIDEEWERMIKAGAFKAIKRNALNPNEKIITSTWAMKKKSNGKYHARLNAQGYEQKCGVHYKHDEISSPTVNDVTV